MGDDRDVPHSKHKKEKHKDRDREREKSRRDSRGERDDGHPARKESIKVRPAGRPLNLPEMIHPLLHVEATSVQCHNDAQHLTTAMRVVDINPLSPCMRVRDITSGVSKAIRQAMLGQYCRLRTIRTGCAPN